MAQTQTLSPPAGAPRSSVRALFAATPGRLRIAGSAAIAACLLFGIVAFTALQARSADVADARNHAAELVRIQAIRTNLTQADAAATNAFLVGGLEPPATRAEYLAGLAGATRNIAAASAGQNSDAATLAGVNETLASYAGLIESARANNRQGFPVGAAYLRQASNLLRDEALPPLGRLVAIEEARVNDAYPHATTSSTLLLVVLGIAFVVLIVVQVWLLFRTRRTFNVGVAAATLVVVGAGVIGAAVMAYAEHSATDVRDGSYAQSVALATARTDAFDAKSAESLTLIAVGSGANWEQHYQSVMQSANTVLQNVSPHDPAPAATLGTYDAAHRNVRRLDDGGNWDAAVKLATGTAANGTGVTFAAFDRASAADLDSQAGRVGSDLDSARAPLVVLAFLILFAGLAAASARLARGRRSTAGIPMRGPLSRRVVGATLLAVAVLAAASCSGSSKAAPPAPPAPTSTSAPATPAVTCANPTASFAPTGPLPPAGSMPAGSYMERIRRRGHLVAGVSADTLLFGFRNPLSGRLEGFDVDMVREVARAIFGDPNRISYKVLTYAQRIPALQSGAVDIVADVMTINCTRWTQIDFSSEYFHAGQKILVRSDSPAKSIADMNGKRMCAAKGSTNIDNLKNYPKIITVGVDDISDCMVLFQEGTVDAVTGDDTVLEGFVVQDPYAKIVGPEFTSEPYGLGIAKAHPEFVQFVNALLERMRQDGTWAGMYRTWLHPTGAAPSPPAALYGRQP